MVWFECTDCGESLKKPKVQNHTCSCSATAFNCIDCGRTFDRHTVKEHTTCVTEHDKYAKGATKPGGYAAQGFYGSQEAAKAKEPQAGEPAGTEFLSTRAPWRCSVCSVTCTSRETLLGHAAGAKHKRRARAASKGIEGAGANGVSGAAASSEPATGDSGAGAAAAAEPAAELGEEQNGHAGIGWSPKKSKKRKADQVASEQQAEAAAGAAAEGAPSSTGRQKENGSAAGKGPKWKKLAAEVLQGRPGRRMKLGKLQAKVLAASGLPASALNQHEAAMLQRWSKSRQFVVQDGYISLS